MTVKRADDDERTGEISVKTRVTVAFVVVCMPFIVWAVRVDGRVESLEAQNRQISAQLEKIKDKLDDLRDRMPARDRSINTPRPLHGSGT